MFPEGLKMHFNTCMKSWCVNRFMYVWMTRRKKREWMKTGLMGNIFSGMCTWHVSRYLAISSDSNYSTVLEIKIVLVKIQLSIYYLPGTLLSMLHVVTHLFLIRIQRGKHNYWRREWQPTPMFLPGESHGWGSLVGCRLWGCTESDNDWSDLAAAAASTIITLILQVWKWSQK